MSLDVHCIELARMVVADLDHDLSAEREGVGAPLPKREATGDEDGEHGEGEPTVVLHDALQDLEDQASDEQERRRPVR